MPRAHPEVRVGSGIGDGSNTAQAEGERDLRVKGVADRKRGSHHRRATPPHLMLRSETVRAQEEGGALGAQVAAGQAPSRQSRVAARGADPCRVSPRAPTSEGRLQRSGTDGGCAWEQRGMVCSPQGRPWQRQLLSGLHTSGRERGREAGQGLWRRMCGTRGGRGAALKHVIGSRKERAEGGRGEGEGRDRGDEHEGLLGAQRGGKGERVGVVSLAYRRLWLGCLRSRGQHSPRAKRRAPQPWALRMGLQGREGNQGSMGQRKVQYCTVLYCTVLQSVQLG